MFTKIIEQKFDKEIRGLIFNPKSGTFIVGLSKRSRTLWHDCEIWSLDQNFEKKNLIYQDPLALNLFKAFEINNEWIILATLMESRREFAKALTFNEKGEYKEIFGFGGKKEAYYTPFISLLNINEHKEPCFIFIGEKPFIVRYTGEINSLTDYIYVELPPKRWNPSKVITSITMLSTSRQEQADIPDMIATRAYNQLEGYKNRNKIFSSDFRTFEAKHIGQINGRTEEILVKKRQNDIFLLFLNRGLPPCELIMVKNFQIWWRLKNTIGPAVVMDIDEDGDEELICSGSGTIKVFKNIYDEKPIEVFQKKIQKLVSILVKDVTNDGRQEIIAGSEKKITIFQKSYQ